MIFFQLNCGSIPNVGTMLAHRLRRWPNIVPTLGRRTFCAHIDVFWKYTAYTHHISDLAQCPGSNNEKQI